MNISKVNLNILVRFELSSHLDYLLCSEIKKHKASVTKVSKHTTHLGSKDFTISPKTTTRH